MKTILVLLIIASLSLSAHSIELAEGEVEGKIKFGSQSFVPTLFVVQSQTVDDGLSYRIEMLHDERIYNFYDLTFNDNQMEFTLDTGQQYSCLLSLDDTIKKNVSDCEDGAGYCGECIFNNKNNEKKRITISINTPETELEIETEDETQNEVETQNEEKNQNEGET